MSGTKDEVGQQDLFDRSPGQPLTWLEFDGACHQSFALGVCSTLDVAEGFRAIETYALAFSRFHVLGDESVSDILDGSEVVSDTVTLQLR